MNTIAEYFNTLVFTKVDLITQMTGKQYIVYAAKLSSKTIDGYRYIIVHVENGSEIYPEMTHLKNLQWTSLQTRTLKSSAYSHLKEQGWSPSKYVNDVDFMYIERTAELTRYVPVINQTIKNTKNPYGIGKQYSTINSHFPFDLILLHNRAKKTIYQYHNNISLLTALNTFSCVLSTLNKKVRGEDDVMELI